MTYEIVNISKHLNWYEKIQDKKHKRSHDNNVTQLNNRYSTQFRPFGQG